MAAMRRGAVQGMHDRRRWLARPWEFAFDVIGRDALDTAAEFGGAQEPVQPFAKEQRDYLAAFCELSTMKVLLSSGRGGTKTFLTAVGLATLAYCIPRFTATVLSGSLEQAKYLYAYWERFCGSDKFGLCIKGQSLRTLTNLENGGWVRVLTASERQVKGIHPQMLVIDEACAVGVDILDLAMGQRLGGSRGLVRALSTPDKFFHPFVQEWMFQAEARGWQPFNWGMRKFLPDGSWEPTFPWVTRATIEDLLANQDSAWVLVHVDGQPGAPSGTVFKYEDIQEAKIESLEADPLYNEEAVVSTKMGLDWGFVHPSVIVISERLVPNPGLVEELGLTVPKELTYIVHVEAWTGKSGDFVRGRVGTLLDDEKLAGDILADSSHPTENEALRQLAFRKHHRAIAVNFGTTKTAMVGNLNLLFETKAIRIPRKFVELLEQLSNYKWEEKKDPRTGEKVAVEKPQKGDDDYVDAAMLSVWGHRKGKAGFVPVTLPRR